MKKLSEVCKIIGVSRRTLQGYAEIGLLQPTQITEGGYWMYDDDAIQRLICIQVFVEVGYERKKIKSILEYNEAEILKEFDKVILMLKEKQNRINGMIATIESFKMASLFPITVKNVLSQVSVSQMYREKSYTEQLEEFIEMFSLFTDDDMNDILTYGPVFGFIFSMGLLKNEAPDSENVQACVVELCKRYINVQVNYEEKNEYEDKPEELAIYLTAKELSEIIAEIKKAPESETILDQGYGEGASDFVLSAFQEYCKLHKYIEDKYELEEHL